MSTVQTTNAFQSKSKSKIEQARAAGYSDDEIADFLAQQDDRVGVARGHGYAATEILGFLGSQAPAAPPPVPAPPPAAKTGLIDRAAAFLRPSGEPPGNISDEMTSALQPVDQQPAAPLVTPDPLSKPFEGFQSSQADLVEQSKSPATRAAAAQAQRPLAEMRAYKPGAGERAKTSVADVTGSRGAGLIASRFVDTALLAPEAVATGAKLVADIGNLATLGAGQGVSDWLGEVTRSIQSQKSDRYKAQQAQLDAILNDDNAGVVDVLEMLAANPGFAAELGVPSLPSMLVGAGAGRAAGALNAALTARRGGAAADVAAAFRTGAAAGAAAAGTALAGRLGGGEAALAGAGARGGALRRGLVTGVQEAGQESLESLSQSLGQGTVEGNLDVGQAMKQAALEEAEAM